MTIKKLFEGVDGLSPEFEERANQLVEQAAEEKAQVIVEAKLQEAENVHAAEIQQIKESHRAEIVAINESHTEALQEAEEQLVNSLDGFLDTTIREWAESNKVGIDQKIKSQLGESLISSLTKVFAEHNIAAPAGGDTIVENLQSELERVNTKMERVLAENQQYKQAEIDESKSSIVESVCAGLVDTQIDEVKSLVEGVAYIDEEQYTRKVKSFRSLVEGKKPEENPEVPPVVTEGDDPVVKPQDPAPVQLTEADLAMQFINPKYKAQS